MGALRLRGPAARTELCTVRHSRTDSRRDTEFTQEGHDNNAAAIGKDTNTFGPDRTGFVRLGGKAVASMAR